MRITYQTNCGQFVLHHDGVPVGPLLDEVSVAYTFDPVDGLYILHKHGSIESVNAWKDSTAAKLSTSGPVGKEMADALRILSGRFPLQDLNEAIGGSQGALDRLVQESRTIDAEARQLPATQGAADHVIRPTKVLKRLN